MRVVLQRVIQGQVAVEGNVVGKIAQGYVLLVGIAADDTREDVIKMADKILHLRVFDDENGKMNWNLQQVQGSILAISQFTLYADVSKGRRPGFERAAKSEPASILFEQFMQELRNSNVLVESGIFQTHMRVSLCNDGPVTILLDGEDWKKRSNLS